MMINKIGDKFIENDFFVTLRDITNDIIAVKNNKFYWFVYMECEGDEIRLEDIPHLELIKRALVTGNDYIYILFIFGEDARIMEARRVIRVIEVENATTVNKSDMRKFNIRSYHNEFNFFA